MTSTKLDRENSIIPSGLLVIYADVNTTAFSNFRDTLKSMHTPVNEMFLTYNTKDRDLENVWAPLDIVDGQVFDSFHRRAYEWQANLPACVLATGQTISDQFSYPDHTIPSHSLWVTRMTPSIQARFAVIELVITALDRFKPEKVCIFGVPLQQSWIVTIAARAAISRGLEIVPAEKILSGTVAGRYVSYRERALKSIDIRRVDFANRTLSRELKRVNRLTARLIDTANRVESTNKRVRVLNDQNLAKASTLNDITPCDDLILRVKETIEAAFQPDMASFSDLGMLEVELERQREMLEISQSIKSDLKEKLDVAKTMLKIRKKEERDAERAEALARSKAIKLARDTLAQERQQIKEKHNQALRANDEKAEQAKMSAEAEAHSHSDSDKAEREALAIAELKQIEAERRGIKESRKQALLANAMKAAQAKAAAEESALVRAQARNIAQETPILKRSQEAIREPAIQANAELAAEAKSEAEANIRVRAELEAERDLARQEHEQRAEDRPAHLARIERAIRLEADRVALKMKNRRTSLVTGKGNSSTMRQGQSS